MKVGKKIAVILIILACILSCKNPLSRIPENNNPTARIKIQITYETTASDGVQVKTIIPDVTNLGLTYRISFTGPETVEPIEITSASTSVVLSYGVWTINVEALNETDVVVASGVGNVDIPTDTIVNIALSLQQSGTGEVMLSLTYTTPVGITVDSISASLSMIGNSDVEELVVDSIDSPVTITGSGILSGDYVLVIQFTDTNSSPMTPYSDIIQVFNNIYTDAVVTINANEFTSLPSSPTNLDLEDTIDGVALEWTDNAHTETGFVIERKEEGGSYIELVEQEGFNITTCTDETASDGMTYYYRVSAKNIFGLSAPCTEVSLTTSSEPRVLYVSEGGTGIGLSWVDALDDVQEAIELAYSYTRKPEVWVAAGTYNPTGMPNITGETDQRYNHFSLRNGVALYGGFAGIETSRSQRNPWSNETILSGDFNGDDVVMGSGGSLSITGNDENAYHVFYHHSGTGIDSTAMIDGFVITGGKANGISEHNSGGGIYNNQCSPKIQKCIIEANSSNSMGGGIYNYSYLGRLEGCVFIHNIMDP
jgi:hypothetical protein